MTHCFTQRRASDRSVESGLPRASAPRVGSIPLHSQRAHSSLGLSKINYGTSRPKEVKVKEKTIRVGFYTGLAAVILAVILAMIFKVIAPIRSEEHTSELQSLMRISYAVFCL